MPPSYRTPSPQGTESRPTRVNDGTLVRLPSPTPSGALRSPVASWDLRKKMLEGAMRAGPKLPAEMREQFYALFSPLNIGITAGVLAVWGGSHLFGAGEVADAGIVVVAYAFLGMSAFQVGYEIGAYAATAATASTDADLDRAGEHLALAVSIIGVNAFFGLMGKFGAKFGEGRATPHGGPEPVLEEETVRAAGPLPDISSRYDFPTPYERNGKIYKTARGELGVPGQVMTHRDSYAQSKISSGTGDHAGHLIGNQFGAPGDARNLSLQNWIANSYGTYKGLEMQWAYLLKRGVRIKVEVTDISRVGEDRPFVREVEWTETDPNGDVRQKKFTFGNFETEKGRTAKGIPNRYDTPQTDNVIPFKRPDP